MRVGMGHRAAKAGQRVAGLIRNGLTAERDRWALWLPVAMGAGVATYFQLPFEPGPEIGLASLAASATLLAAYWRRGGRKALALGLFAAALGFAAAELRTALVAAPMLNETLSPARIEGRVRVVEFLPGGRRIRLGDVIIPGLVEPPAQLRLRLASLVPPLVPGDWIRLKATLGPPSRPVAPGSYDFRRDLFFDRIGGVGFALSRPKILDDDSFGGRAPFLHRFWQNLTNLRTSIESRMLTAMPDPGVAGVAVAFVTGSQTAVPNPVLLAMRSSGLAHLLSVSGLHVGLAVGILFFLTRAILALIPPIALNWPIKKWAAALALLGAGFYMLLSGASVPVVRSFLMAGIVLLAIIVDRQAISMRPVALAALVVLLFWPDSLVGPSFQLSFAAIVALTAVWEELSLLRQRETGLLRRGLRWLFDLALSSMIATLATAAFGIYHFNRVTGYGIVANMLAVPLTGFWIMPWLILSLLLMPFHLEAWALQPAGWGISAILWTAQTVAAWPGAVSLVPALPPFGLAAVSLGGLWLCLWRRRWRFAGLLGIAAGLAVIPFSRPPDILVSEDARLVAIVEADGSLRLSSRQMDRFAASEWLRRFGQARALSWNDGFNGADPRLACQQGNCRFRVGGRQVAILENIGGFERACTEADVVIALVPVAGSCAAPLIDPARLARNGGYAVWLNAAGPVIESVRDKQGSRPWVPPRIRPDDAALDEED